MSFGKTNYRTGGTRGGADQFKWDDVKNDKYRENYLGHSLHAPVGRWQKGKDLNWYSKMSKEDQKLALQEEIALAKQRDQELMDQALGIAPKRRAEPTGALDAAEVKELLKRGASDREGLEAERVEGLGAAPVAHDFTTKPKKTLAEKYQEEIASGRGEQNIHAIGGTVAVDQELSRAQKKLKKEKKAMKKAKKKEKKERKHRTHDSDAHRSEARSEAGGRPRSRSRERGERRHQRSPSPASSASSVSRRSRSPAGRRSYRRSYSPSPSPPRRYQRQSRSRSRERDRRRPSQSRSPPNRRSRSPPRHRRGRSRSQDRRR